MKKICFIISLSTSILIISLSATSSIANTVYEANGVNIPPNCVVSSWCVNSSTSCSFMRMWNPRGLFQGEAQYSIVRSGKMSCDMGYGRWEEKSFQGPVEPVIFRSGIETTEEKAQAEALRLCNVYRDQWLGAAPACSKR